MSDERPTRQAIPSIQELGPRFFEFLNLIDRPVVFLDIEATGTDHQRDRIVELSVMRVMPLPVGLEAPRTWRVNPKQRIPQEASEVHGIYNSDLEDAPTFPEIAEEVAQLLRGADIAGFAVSRFDVRLLRAEFTRARVDIDLTAARVIDTQVIYHTREPRNLAAAVRFYCDQELEGAHGAEADTVASLRVLAGQLSRYDDLELSIEELDRVCDSVNEPYVDRTRRFAWKDGEPAFNFGKLKGKSLRWAAGDPEQRAYLRRLLQSPMEEDARQVMLDALAGKIRTRGARR